MRVKCLACDSENDALATSGYCDHCGKKLPASAMVRTKRALRTGSDGDDEPRDTKARSAVFEALLTATVVQLICGGLFLVVGPTLLTSVPETFLTSVFLWTLFPTVGLGACAILARVQPRYAVLAAIGIYVVWAGVGFAWQPIIARAWVAVHGVMAAVLAWVGYVGFKSS